MTKTTDPTEEAAKLAAAYDAAARGPVKIDWTRPTVGILDQTERRNNPQYFQADTMDKIVAATGRTVGVFPIGDVRIPNAAPAQSMALAWKGGEA